MNSKPHIHFVTGRLAEKALRAMVADLASQIGFDYSIDVLPITVAALMTPEWISKRVDIPEVADRVILPGYCRGDIGAIQALTRGSVEVGPKDLRQLPTFFQRKPREENYGEWNIEIIAEINHAPRMTREAIVAEARRLAEKGADVIDIGCEPQSRWSGVGDCVKAVRDLGLRVSIDSLDPKEIGEAVKAGAELVLSVNGSNRRAAVDWGCEVVVIPDDVAEIESMEETVEWLVSNNVPFRLDPILEPIGFGFARSLRRYMETRQRYPEASMMMGIGNLTELTDCDSAGINVLLMAICQELEIHSVLTTEVINWAQSSVRECAVARQLVHYAIHRQLPPKHLDRRLIMLRDAEVTKVEREWSEQLAAEIKDNNYRIFTGEDKLHLVGKEICLEGVDPFTIFDQLADRQPGNLDASHAFYLGFEMCKAMIANQLGKEYRQDEALDWGILTVEEEDRHRLRRRRRGSDVADE